MTRPDRTASTASDEASSVAAAVLDASSEPAKARILAANGPFAALLGRMPDSVAGLTLEDLSGDTLIPSELIAVLDGMSASDGQPSPRRLTLPNSVLRCELLSHASGRLLLVTGESLPDLPGAAASPPSHGAPPGQSEERLRSLFENAEFGIAFTDAEGRIVEVNPRLAAMLKTAAPSLDRQAFRRFVHPDDQADLVERFKELLSDSRNRWKGEIRLLRADGKPLWVRINASRVGGGAEHRPHSLAVLLEDVSGSRRTERRIRYLAHYDQATGLPNASLFEQRVDGALARADQQRNVPLLVIGFDRLPALTLSLDRDSAERLVLHIIDRLRRALGLGAVLGRLGDAVFGAMLVTTDEDATLKAIQAVLEAFTVPLPADQRELSLSPTLGVSFFPRDGHRAEPLIRAASAALQQAREQPSARYALFEPEMAGATVARLNLEGRLRRAIEQNEFELHYQPIARTETLEIVGFEALLRWHDPSSGYLSPAEFIPVAEESGLIVPLGELVIEAACRQAAQWRADGVIDAPISVNLSGRQLAAPGLCDKVLAALARHGLPADRLKFELTETVLFRTAGMDRETLFQLHEAGVHLLLDDFGTGYSSLGYLKQFPIEAIKIDRSFVHGMDQDSNSALIVQAITNMAHALGMQVVAEGAETQEELMFLRAYRCDRVQGYLISKPRPAAEIEGLLRGRG